VTDAAISPLAGWENFYVIVGSSAGALTGLQFVVLTLIAQAPQTGGAPEIAAFGTPTIVHFCAVLLIAAIVSCPWPALSEAALTLGATAVAGMIYSAVVIRRARRVQGYRPVFEDWLWHTILPAVAYTALLGAAIALGRDSVPALFDVAIATLLLLFIGIHNAWDTVTYIVIQWFRRQDKPKDQ
jgi:hypothetical protein